MLTETKIEDAHLYPASVGEWFEVVVKLPTGFEPFPWRQVYGQTSATYPMVLIERIQCQST